MFWTYSLDKQCAFFLNLRTSSACALAPSLWGRRLVGTTVLVWGQGSGIWCCSTWGAPALSEQGRQVPTREELTLPFSALQNFENKVCLFCYLSLSWCDSAKQHCRVCCPTLAPEWHLAVLHPSFTRVVTAGNLPSENEWNAPASWKHRWDPREELI